MTYTSNPTFYQHTHRETFVSWNAGRQSHAAAGGGSVMGYGKSWGVRKQAAGGLRLPRHLKCHLPCEVIHYEKSSTASIEDNFLSPK